MAGSSALDLAPARPRRLFARWLGRVSGPGSPSVDFGRSRSTDLATLLAEVDRLESELSAARAHVAELESVVDIDPLTRVLNRRGFARELERTLAHIGRYGGSAALIYLDLDDFKPINDRHGHAAGDAVLQSFAAALQRKVRGSDAVARPGGDEFAVILWNLDAAAALAKARALEIVGAEDEVPWGGERLAVGASAGVAMIDPARPAADVVAQADQAMYARKAERRSNRAQATQ